ncbi:inositol monophosphatase family protein [Aliiroseovarius sp. F20344]|uniref:inositol monophosphatase family protein n=1 Tax=Aliiroseovarius sp. F20344 TaxID=2926414 RepID=UPI001FF6437E|nr:inositol monophosphatase family protein [Aliiroseovarius sp. F20344]MCK0143642.1 inositol monophosphatase [Aliiroseovarius sp. F20344]
METLRTRFDIARKISVDVSPVAMEFFRKELDITSKSDESPVTIADQNTETAIRTAIAASFPEESILGEEFGQSGDRSDMWIVDPIDGTRSFITGLPLFGILLGYLSDDVPQLGVVNMPALGEVYSGAQGLGAYLNGAQISVSACKTLKRARLFINEADKLAQEAPQQFVRMITAGDLRRFGADCYPHMLVASGYADAVIDFGLQPYDYLPVAAVVEAAGGIMTDWHGRPLSLTSDGRTVTAATPELHAELLELVRP